MNERIKEIYDALGDKPPDRLAAGMAVWTLITSADVGGEIECLNPATKDTQEIRVSRENYPDEIAGTPVFIDSVRLNPAVKQNPVRVILPASGFRGTWVQKAVKEPSDLEQSLYSDHKRENRVEWEGTEQKNTEEVKRRNTVFHEGDDRGSMNDLIK